MASLNLRSTGLIKPRQYRESVEKWYRESEGRGDLRPLPDTRMRLVDESDDLRHGQRHDGDGADVDIFRCRKKLK